MPCNLLCKEINVQVTQNQLLSFTFQAFSGYCLKPLKLVSENSLRKFLHHTIKASEII